MVIALLKTKEDMQNYIKQYRENNKEKIDQLNQQSYNCLYCDRQNLHVYYKKQHEKTKYCLKRRQGSRTESLTTVQLIKQITD